jgi:hypothetical protein
LLETVHERCEAGLPIRTVRSGIHKGANAPHPIRLLRARRERPCDRCAAKQRDEIAATDVDCHVTLPWEDARDFIVQRSPAGLPCYFN